MIAMAFAAVAAVLCAAGLLFFGTTDIPAAEVWQSLVGGEGVGRVARTIVLEVRVPMAVTSFFAGVALGVAGLLLQTAFANPLAGPSILGVSTGASLGVAVVMLLFGGWIGSGVGYYAGILSGATAGALAVMALLLIFSRIVRSGAMLLIIGVLIGYLTSSAISLLNFFSTQQGVHSYVIWGLGNFAGVSGERLAVFSVAVAVAVAVSVLFVKPLDCLLLGDRYAESMGVNVRRLRNGLMILSGVLAAVVTAFCGPIGFLGLVVPHIARFATGRSAHHILLPATMLFGGATALFCALLSVVAGLGQIIPVNAITPLVSIPVIIWVIIRRKGERL